MQCNDDLGLVSLVLLAFSAALGGSALQGLRVQPDGHRFRRVQHRLLVFQRVHHRFVFPSLVLPVLFFALEDSNSSSQSAGCRVSEAPHPTQLGNGAKILRRRLIFQRVHHQLVCPSLPPRLHASTQQQQYSVCGLVYFNSNQPKPD